MVNRLDLSDKELQTDSGNAKSKLDNLQQRSDTVLSDLKTQLKIESQIVCEELKSHLQTDQCRQKITQNWTLGIIPNVDQGLGDWNWVRSHIQEAFFDKVVDCVQEWDRGEDRMVSIEQTLACDVKSGLLLLENELKDVEREIQGDSSSESSEEMSDLSKSRRRSMPRSPISKAQSLLSQRPKLPLKLAGRMIKPFKKILNPVMHRLKINEYKRNPILVAERCAAQMYSELLDESQCSGEGLMIFADYLFERPREYLEAIENRIPHMILSNQLLLNRLVTSIEEEKAHHTEYEQMMTMTEALRRSLMEYGKGYIFVEDFSRGELQIQQSVEGNPVSVAFNVTDFLRYSSGDLDLRQRQDIRALWTVTYAGCLNRNCIDRAVAIRVYLPSSGIEFTYNEVAKLRY